MYQYIIFLIKIFIIIYKTFLLICSISKDIILALIEFFASLFLRRLELLHRNFARSTWTISEFSASPVREFEVCKLYARDFCIFVRGYDSVSRERREITLFSDAGRGRGGTVKLPNNAKKFWLWF